MEKAIQMPNPKGKKIKGEKRDAYVFRICLEYIYVYIYIHTHTYVCVCVHKHKSKFSDLIMGWKYTIS